MWPKSQHLWNGMATIYFCPSIVRASSHIEEALVILSQYSAIQYNPYSISNNCA